MSNNFYTNVTLFDYQGALASALTSYLNTEFGTQTTVQLNFLSYVVIGYALQGTEIRKTTSGDYILEIQGQSPLDPQSLSNTVNALIEELLDGPYQFLRLATGSVFTSLLSPNYESEFRLLDASNNVIGGMVSTDALDSETYLTKIGELLEQAIENSWSIPDTAKIQIIDPDVPEGSGPIVETYSLVNAEILMARLQDIGISSQIFDEWSNGTVQNDMIHISGAGDSYNYFILGTLGSDQIVFKYTIDSTENSVAVSWNQINLSEENLIRILLTGSLTELVYGSSSDDEIQGTYGADILLGNGANDTFKYDGTFDRSEGLDGDKIDGGDGEDTIDYSDIQLGSGAEGVSVSLASGIAERVDLAGAQDQLYNIENIIGSSKDDALDGDGQSNTITGGLGEDVIRGYSGDDQFINTATTTLEEDSYDGGTGSDTVDYSQFTMGLSFDVSNSGAGSVQKWNSVTNALSGNVDVLIDVENIIGTAGDDRFIDNASAVNTYNGGGGTETFDYSGSVSGVTINIGGKIENGADTLIGIENITGSTKNDTFNFVNIYGTDTSAISGGGQVGTTFDVADFTDISDGVTIRGDGTIEDSEITISNFEHFKGGTGDDIIVSNGKLDAPGGNYGGFIVIDTGDGADKVTASGRGIVVNLGEGEDTLYNPGFATVVFTGLNDGDEDNIYHGNNVMIADAGTEDRIHVGTKEISGGWKGRTTESAWSLDNSGTIRYTLNEQGDLMIQNMAVKVSEGDQPYATTYLANYKNTLMGAEANTAGILIYEASFQVARLMEMKNLFNQGYGLLSDPKMLDAQLEAALGDQYDAQNVDPLIFDLDGDGVEVVPEYQLAPKFDMNGDGFAERVGWAGRDDGFLVQDTNANGKIDDISEMMGAPGSSGFAELATLDSNEDGVIDSDDDDFDTLKIWKDANSNGLTETGELKTLTEWNITSIDVTPTTTTPVNGDKYTITASGTYTTTTGTGVMSDVIFRNNMHDTKWLTEVTVSSEAAALPQIKGYGTIADLRDVMTLDEDLVTAVEAALPNMDTTNLEYLRTAMLPVLNAWAAAIEVPPGSPGTDARQDLYVLTRSTVKEGIKAVDYAIEVTGGEGSYWKLASGHKIKDAFGVTITQPTFEQVTAYIDKPGDSWSILKADEISFMERWWGVEFPIGLNTPSGSSASAGGIDIVDQMWGQLNKLAVSFAAQSEEALGGFFEGVTYNPVSGKFSPVDDRQVAPLLEAIFEAAPGDENGAISYLMAWKPVLDVVLENFSRGESGKEVTYGFLFQSLVTAYENIGFAGSITQAALALDIPEELIITGEGTISGSSDPDIFYMDSADQVAQGGGGMDTYVFGENFGNDVIEDIEVTIGADNPDVVRFSHVGSTDVTATRVGNDLIISVDGTDDVLTIIDQFKVRPPGLFGGFTDYARSISEIVFADGVVWDKFDIAYAVSHPIDTDNTLIGSGKTDVMDGGLGNDLLKGKDSADIYIYGQGYGQDTIYEDGTYFLIDGDDAVSFKSDIEISDLSFSRDGNSRDLLISVTGTTDTLTIQDQFYVAYTGILGNLAFYRVENFFFSDGSSITWRDIVNEIKSTWKTEGNDTIYGFNMDDTLDGGAGDDYLSGGNDRDTYIFGHGYDHDTVDDQMNKVLGDTVDIVQFLEGVTPEEVHLSRIGSSNNLVITLSDGSTLTVIDQFNIKNTFIKGAFSFNAIESFVFADSTTWDQQDIFTKLIEQATTSGNDTIYGFKAADVFEASAGDDTIYGGAEGDTYHFGRGSGHDTINDFKDASPFTPDIDRIVMASDILPSDITITAANGGESFILTINDTGDSIKIVNQNHRFVLGGGWYQIEEVVFADDTVWTPTEMRTMYLENAGTSGNDIIYGFFNDNVLDGGAGDDELYGNGNGDTYIFGPGYGHDYVYDYIEKITWNNPDRVLFTDGITAEDLTFTKSGDRLVVGLVGHTDTLTLDNFFRSAWAYGIESFEFSNNTSMSYDEIYEAVMGTYGTSGNDTMTGTSDHDRLLGRNGNDTIYGLGDDDQLYGEDGNDVIEGGDGDDYLSGGAGSDTLDGGSGDDHLVGGTGSDTYLYSSGNDTFENGSSSTTDYIQVKAATSLTSADIVDIYRNLEAEDDLHILLSTGALLTVSKFFSSTNYRINSIEFLSDSSTVALSGMTSVKTYGSDESETITGINYGSSDVDIIDAGGGDDIVQGGNGNDILDGGAGNDELYGGNGDDVYIFSGGYDRFFDTNGTDEVHVSAALGVTKADITAIYANGDYDLVIDLGDGNVFTLSDAYDWANERIEKITFLSDSSEIILSDLVVQEYRGDEDDDVLGIDYNEANTVVFGFGGEDNLYGSMGVDTIYGGDDNDWLRGFGNNDLLYGEDGDDLLWGLEGDDYLDGGAGNDELWGDSFLSLTDGMSGEDYSEDIGDDRYIATAGDDIIADAGGHDRIIFPEGVTFADLSFSRDGLDIVISWLDNTITIIRQMELVNEGNLYANGIDELVFSDSSTYQLADYTNSLPPIPVELFGDSEDSYFDAQYGYVTIEDEGGLDNLSLSGNFSPEDLVSAIRTGDNLVLSFGNYLDTITIVDQYEISGDHFIESSNIGDLSLVDNWIFGTADDDSLTDASAVSEETIFAGNGNDLIDLSNGGNNVVYAGAGEDEIIGGADEDGIIAGAGSDLLEGGQGDDYLNGGTGNDFYFYELGDGHDSIVEDDGIDSIVFGPGITFEDLTFQINQSIMIIWIGELSAGSIAIESQYASNGIEWLVFDDESTFSLEGAFLAGDYDDVVYATEDADDISTFGGDDYIEMYAGNDVINAGGGNDTIAAGAGDDTIDGGDGTDTLTYINEENGIILSLVSGIATDGFGDTDAISNIENVIGTNEDDIITGSSDNNILIGEAGEDDLSGGDGDDILYGGWNADMLDGGDGNDTANFSDGQEVTVSLVSNEAVSGSYTDNLVSIENVVGSGYNDTITGNSSDNIITGGTGDDNLAGGAGNDSYFFSFNAYEDVLYTDQTDEINDTNGADDSIMIAGSEPLLVTDITWDQDGDDLIIFYGDDGEITVKDHYLLTADNQVEKLYINNDYESYLDLLTLTWEGSNVAPVLTSNSGGPTASTNVVENSTAVTTVTATDADAATTLVYSISGGDDAAKFSINNTTGVLAFIAAQNFEAPTDVGANNVYDVQVQVSDGTLTDTQDIAVTITNVNEAPGITSNSGGSTASVSVAENDTAVTTVTASDVDASTTLTYSITGGADSAKFSINSSTGVLAFVSAQNFESPTDSGANNVYDVQVQVSDGTLTDVQDIAVTVTNINENPVITSNSGGSTASTSVSENGTAVTTVSASDVDASTTLTYSIAGGSDSAKFSINSSTGVLTFVSAQNYESPTDAGANNVYDVQVQASDGTLTDTQDIAVTVTNVNEAPAITSYGGSSSASVNVAENATAVTTIVSSDVDAGASLTYSISGGADSDKFSIHATTGVLSLVSALNFESPADAGTNNVYDVQVQVSDGTLTDTQDIAVTITNVNENPAITSNGAGSTASVNVGENSTSVTTVSASDVDASTTLVYSIIGGSDAAKFSINSSTGVLTFVSAQNYELPTDAGANNVYDVQVQVSDGTLTDTQDIAVTVTNVNEAPAITSNGSGSTASTNVVSGTTAVTTVTASDVDAASTLTYSITGGADSAKFTINSTTGVLAFVSAPNYASPTDTGANNVYDVQVQVSDGALTDVQDIAVTVTSGNHNPDAKNDAFTISYGSDATGNLFTDNGSGADTDEDSDTLSITPTIIGSTQGAIVTISSNGDFSYASRVDYVGTDTFTYTALDGQGGSDSATVTITINAPSGAIVGTSAAQTITGTSGADVIFALGGSDTVNANAGDDTIYGGDISDMLNGGDGNDTLHGGDGNDVLNGGNNDDILEGAFGSDDLTGGSGTDTAKWNVASTGFIVYRDNSSYVRVLDTNNLTSSGYGNDRLYTGVETIQFTDTSIDLTTVTFTLNGAGWGTAATVNGTSSAETLTGYNSRDIIYAGAGNDTINANFGNDDIYGEAGGDSLNGGDGNDYLNGGADNDTLNAGNGNDILDGGDGADTLNGNDGNDDLTGGLGSDNYNGGNGTDRALFGVDSTNFIIYRTSSGYLTVRDTGTSGYGVDLVTNDVESIVFNDITFDLTTTTFTLNGVGWGTAATVTGTSSSDVHTGYNSRDIIYAGAGNDTINANYGNDDIYGEAGIDVLNGADGNDYLNGGADGDTLNGGAGNDTLDGDSGADVLNGNDGNDTLQGGLGSDDYNGGNGTDVSIWGTASTGFIIYRDNANFIRVVDTNSGAAYGNDRVYTDVESVQFTDITFDLATTTFTLNGEGWGTAATVTLGSTDSYTGTQSRDIVYGGSNTNVINGGYGNDDLYGLAGTDTLSGGYGNDYLNGGDGTDTLNGNEGNDTLEGGLHNDDYNGGTGTDVVVWNVASTGFIIYRDNASFIRVLDTNSGAAYGNDRVYSDVESIQFTDITFDLTTTTFTLNGEGWGTAATITLGSTESYAGTQARDIVYGGSNNNTITGGYGNDDFYGLSGADTLSGGYGNDYLSGGDGADTLNGNEGNDTLEGGGSNDDYNGGTGTDVAVWDTASTGFIVYRDNASFIRVVDTNSGTLYGNDRIYTDVESIQFTDVTLDLTTISFTNGGEGWGTAATVTLGSTDSYTGTQSRDIVYGGSSTNIINGGYGNDDLYGLAGNDTLSGGYGNDKLYGGSGLDAMSGGAGADTFAFEAASAYSNIDTISDFSTAQSDAIDVSDVISLYDPLNDAITDWVEFTTSGSNTVVRVDQDGTGSTYSMTQIATLTGVTGLTDEAALVTNGNLIV